MDTDNPLPVPVILQTTWGDLVAERAIPKFVTGYPAVLIWGLRLFRHHKHNTYRECHYWTIPLSLEEAISK